MASDNIFKNTPCFLFQRNPQSWPGNIHDLSDDFSSRVARGNQFKAFVGKQEIQ